MSKNFRNRISPSRKAVFSLFILAGFCLSVEGLLRLTGFQYDTSVETMTFTFPIDEYNRESEEPFLERDEHLFWKTRPFALGHNSRGLIGPEFTDAKAAGVFRIVCIGDSCTHFGPDTYPEMLQALLDAAAPGRFEVINAGCIGYSSWQGLTLLREQVSDWSPDLVTVYFGWNDHWLARGYRDSQQLVQSTMRAPSWEPIEQLRFVQFMRWSAGHLAAPPKPEPRVRPDEYRKNLEAMHQVCMDLTADIWYLTAPHAFDFGIPAYLLTSGEVADPSQIIALHNSYNDVVRQVADERKADCLDLDRNFREQDALSLFVDDHIHLSEEGRLLVAETIFERLKQNGILKPTADDPRH